MADREKLIGLLDKGINKYHYSRDERRVYEGIADHLIANGVTFASDNNVGRNDVPDNNVGKCDYCHEDREGYRKMIGAFSITNPFHGSTWQIETAHCKPRNIYFCPMCGRKLAEPPKGE